MASTNRRHLEFFGPDLLRSPALSGSPPVAAVQIAAGLAQLRVPLLRDDTQIEAHVDFIRALADRLLPDYAVAVRTSVSLEASNQIKTTFTIDGGEYSLLHAWLADSRGGLPTANLPTTVSFTAGTIVQTIADRAHYLLLVPETGVIEATITETGDETWYWALSRFGRVYYSDQVNFA
jgi:hypothetical protein